MAKTTTAAAAPAAASASAGTGFFHSIWDEAHKMFGWVVGWLTSGRVRAITLVQNGIDAIGQAVENAGPDVRAGLEAFLRQAAADAVKASEEQGGKWYEKLSAAVESLVASAATKGVTFVTAEAQIIINDALLEFRKNEAEDATAAGTAPGTTAAFTPAISGK